MASYLDLGAVVGTFTCGDGTLCGEPSVPHYDSPDMTLKGGAFATNLYEDFEQMVMAKSRLILKGAQVDATHTAVLATGRPILYLRGKATNVIVPIVSEPGRPVLVLKGKPFNLAISDTENPGKGVLYLRGKTARGRIPGLTENVPVDMDLVPTTPQSVDLIPTTPQTLDLTPTTEEFR